MDDPAASSSKQVRKRSAELNRTAKAFERGTGTLVDSSERRTILSLDRTILAAERTYAAWVRTALASLASGVGARALLKDMLPAWVGRLTGTVLILFAGFCIIAAVWRELHGVKPLRQPDVKPLPHALLVPVNAFLLLVAIAALVGIWSA
jgi:putative membrane protein